MHTFKRDYVLGAELRDAETVLAQLASWFDDYNRQAPYSAARHASARRLSGASRTHTPICLANWGADHTPGYDAKEDAGLLYFLSSKDYPLRLQARHTGLLWLTVNDADGLRFDNAELFFVKITIR